MQCVFCNAFLNESSDVLTTDVLVTVTPWHPRIYTLYWGTLLLYLPPCMPGCISATLRTLCSLIISSPFVHLHTPPLTPKEHHQQCGSLSVKWWKDKKPMYYVRDKVECESERWLPQEKHESTWEKRIFVPSISTYIELKYML